MTEEVLPILKRDTRGPKPPTVGVLQIVNSQERQLHVMLFPMQSQSTAGEDLGQTFHVDRKRKNALWIAGLFLLFFGVVWGLHHRGFDSPMTYDSKAFIQKKASVFSRNNPFEIIGVHPIRPLVMLSFQLNYALTGMNPYFFRLFNAAVVAASGVALVIMVLLLFRLCSAGNLPRGPDDRWIALFIGLCFVVHPVQEFVVLYVWQRSAIMATFFFFCGFAVYLSARSGLQGGEAEDRVSAGRSKERGGSSHTQHSGDLRLKRPVGAYVAASALMLGGMLSKELLLAFPLTLLAAEVVLYRSRGRELLRAALVIGIISLPPVMAYMLSVSLFHGPETTVQKGTLDRLVYYYRISELGPVEVLLTQCRMWCSYLLMVFAPWLHGMELVRAEIISVSLSSPPSTLPACLGVTALIGTAGALVKRRPLVSFGIFFYTITMLPESLLIPYYQYFGYRPVLPVAGLLCVAADGLRLVQPKLKERFPRRARVPAVCVAALLFVGPLAAMTYRQASSWSPLEVWRNAFLKLPPFSPSVERVPYVDILVNYGLELVDVGDYPGAAEVLEKATRINPNHPDAHHNLANVFLRIGRIEEAISHLEQAVALKPDYAEAHHSLGKALVMVGRVPEAVEQFKTTLRIRPDHVQAYIGLGNAMLKENRASEAVTYFQKAIELAPSNPVVVLSVKNALEKARQTPSSPQSGQ